MSVDRCLVPQVFGSQIRVAGNSCGGSCSVFRARGRPRGPRLRLRPGTRPGRPSGHRPGGEGGATAHPTHSKHAGSRAQNSAQVLPQTSLRWFRLPEPESCAPAAGGDAADVASRREARPPEVVAPEPAGRMRERAALSPSRCSERSRQGPQLPGGGAAWNRHHRWDTARTPPNRHDFSFVLLLLCLISFLCNFQVACFTRFSENCFLRPVLVRSTGRP